MNLIGITFTQSPPDPLSVSAIIIAIITAIWSIVSYIIRKSTDKKYQEQIEAIKTQNQKEIEQYKSELVEQVELLKAQKETLNYITKTQFDAEFKMYQELSASSFEAIMTLRILDKEVYLGKFQEEYNKRWKLESLEKVNSFATTVYKYAPFIEEKFFVRLNDLAKQINDINNNIEFDNDGNIIKNNTLIEEEKKVLKAQQNLIADLRKYLRTLQVIEDK